MEVTKGTLPEGDRAVDKVRAYFDRKGNTLSVWFDDPKKQHVCEESEDDVIVVKDRRGRVIGFERLLENPPRPSSALRKAMSKHARRHG